MQMILEVARWCSSEHVSGVLSHHKVHTIHTPPSLPLLLPLCLILLLRAAFAHITRAETQEMLYPLEITSQEILEAAAYDWDIVSRQ